MLKRIKDFGQSLKGLTRRKAPDRIEKALNLPKPVQTAKAEDTKQHKDHSSAAYMELKILFRNVGRMNAIIETLGRDFLTAMPAGAYISRLGQIAFLYRRMHEDLADQSLPGILDKAKAHAAANPPAWDAWDRANLREMETTIRHHAGIPADLMEKRARLSYEGRHVHRDVLKNNDWEQAKVFLEGMIDLQQRIADAKQVEDNTHPENRYQALLREFMPGIRLHDIDRLFGDYKQAVDILLPQIIAAQNAREAPIEPDGVFTGKSQMWLNRTMLSLSDLISSAAASMKPGIIRLKAEHPTIRDWSSRPPKSVRSSIP